MTVKDPFIREQIQRVRTTMQDTGVTSQAYAALISVFSSLLWLSRTMDSPDEAGYEVSHLSPPCLPPLNTAEDAAAEPEGEPTKAEETAEPEPEQEVHPDPDPETEDEPNGEYTQTQVREALFDAKTKHGFDTSVVVRKYARNFSEVPESSYGALMADLRAALGA